MTRRSRAYDIDVDQLEDCHFLWVAAGNCSLEPADFRKRLVVAANLA